MVLITYRMMKYNISVNIEHTSSFHFISFINSGSWLLHVFHQNFLVSSLEPKQYSSKDLYTCSMVISDKPPPKPVAKCPCLLQHSFM